MKTMPQYRRLYIPGGTYFYTVVTFNRKPIFLEPKTRALLKAAWLDTKRRFPFQTEAYCLFPDHLHCIWTLPEGDADYSTRWKEIKRLFSMEYLKIAGPGGFRNTSRRKHIEAAIWQRRFWEHSIRDQEDFNNHVAYIHFNPVKHGLVKQVIDWPWSSFHRYVEMGLLDPDWGEVDIDLAAGE
jgi:putative transposase